MAPTPNGAWATFFVLGDAPVKLIVTVRQDDCR